MINNIPDSAVEEIVQEFKNNKEDLLTKSNAFIFMMLEINDKYFHYSLQDLNDKARLRQEIAECIFSDKEDAVVSFITTTHENEADEVDFVMGKCNYEDNCTQSQIKTDIKNLISCYKKLSSMYDKCIEDESDLYEQFASCYEESLNGLKKFCLLYPKTINQNNSIDLDDLQVYFNLIKSEFPSNQNYVLEIEISNTILSDINNMQSTKPIRTVSHASINIDHNNVLHYKNDAIIVSVNGKSLHDLYGTYRNNLLEANLRYYIRSPKIDNEITSTIKYSPTDFWYLNNGLTIICNNFKVSENKVELFGFSIVNGGQTTYLINRMDENLENDLFVVCKIIKISNHSENENEFILKIAQASNRQKPIRDQDLTTNKPEQLEFSKLCAKYGLVYEVRRGMPKAKEPWQRGNISVTGKLFLASLLQVPADSRGSASKLFKDEKYAFMFPDNSFLLNNHALIASQLAKIDYCYHKYTLQDIKKQRRWIKQAKYAKNAKTVVIAFITLLSRLAYHTFSFKDLKEIINSLDLYNDKSANSYISNNCIDLFPDSVNFKQIYQSQDDWDIKDLQDKLTPIFDYVVDNGYKAFEKAKRGKPDLTETNYLKSNVSYYQFLALVINSLPNDIDQLFDELR